MRKRLKKKITFGTRKSDTKLFIMFSSIKITTPPVTLYQDYEPYCAIEDSFCLNCGHKVTWRFDNYCPHPEVWFGEKCNRCGNTVAVADNSPYQIACLEARNEMPSDLTKSQYRNFIKDWLY